MKKLCLAVMAALMLGVVAFCVACEEEPGTDIIITPLFRVEFVSGDAIFALIDTGAKDTLTLPENPAKDGYTFGGWFYDNDAWQKPLTAGSLVTEPLTKNLRVYAKWTAIEVPPVKAAPTAAISGVVPTKTGVSFKLDIADPDETGALSALALYRGDTKVKDAAALTAREFTEILSNTAYQIKATYTYNLGDGAGSKTVSAEASFATLAKVTPTCEISNVVPTKTGVSFAVDIFDPDNTGAINKIVLYRNGVKVRDADALTDRVFTGLLSDTEYEIDVSYEWSSNDGEVWIMYKAAYFTTLALEVPSIALIPTGATRAGWPSPASRARWKSCRNRPGTSPVIP